VFEEFDYQNEYYFDEDRQLLYYFHNGTGSPDPEAEVARVWLVPRADRLVLSSRDFSFLDSLV